MRKDAVKDSSGDFPQGWIVCGVGADPSDLKPRFQSLLVKLKRLRKGELIRGRVQTPHKVSGFAPCVYGTLELILHI